MGEINASRKDCPIRGFSVDKCLHMIPIRPSPLYKYIAFGPLPE
jgi:hypothetical protein